MTDNKEREAFESLYAKHYPIGRDDEGYFDSDVDVAWLAWQRRAALALSQSSAEAVRDAALEEAANTATGFLVGDPLAGIPLRNPMTHEIADAIRALKSAPPQPAEKPDECGEVVVTWDEDRTRILAVTRQDGDGRVLKIIALVPPGRPAEQPSASPFALFESGYALTDEEITKLAESMPGGLEGFLRGWGWQNFARAVESEVMLALARAQGEQSAPTPAAADRYVKCIECCKNFVRSDLDLICKPCRDGQTMPGADTEGA